MMMDSASGLNVEVINGIRGIRKATTSQQSEGLLLSTVDTQRRSEINRRSRSKKAKIAASVGLGPEPNHTLHLPLLQV